MTSIMKMDPYEISMILSYSFASMFVKNNGPSKRLEGDTTSTYNNVRFKTPTIRSDLCEYSKA